MIFQGIFVSVKVAFPNKANFQEANIVFRNQVGLHLDVAVITVPKDTHRHHIFSIPTCRTSIREGKHLDV